MRLEYSGRLRAVVGVGAAAMMLVASSCSNGSGGSAATPAAAGTSGGSGQSSPAASGIVGEMTALIDQHRAQPRWADPGPAVDAHKLAGKTIAIVSIDMRVPAISEIAQYAKEAADQVGMKVTVFDAKGTASLMQQGMQQAINNGADAIISNGLVIDLVAGQIKAAKDKGIPTIDVINTPPKEGVPGQGSNAAVFGNMAPDSTLTGQLIAAAAITQTGGKATVGIINTSELTAASTEITAMKDTLGKCADCRIVAEQDVALSDWSTEITGVTSTMVRSHPEMNYVLTLYDAMGIFATSGVQTAGATGKVKIASVNGTAAALALVRKGDIYAADIAQSTEWAAWGAVDQAMRGMLKMAPADPVLPIRYVDTQMLKNVDTTSTATVTAALFGDGFRTGYRKLWGLS